jgi:hypothetical protein
MLLHQRVPMLASAVLLKAKGHCGAPKVPSSPTPRRPIPPQTTPPHPTPPHLGGDHVVHDVVVGLLPVVDASAAGHRQHLAALHMHLGRGWKVMQHIA